MMRRSALGMCLLLWVAAARAQDTASSAEFYSKAGVLTATLVAREQKIHVGDLDVDGIIYNGYYAGPVLHVHPGDVMHIRLVNELSQPTNLHFHGIRTSPLGNSDNPHLVVQPKTSFSYEVKIPPSQPTGLFWYHAHMHGVSERQIMGGLSGALVVEGQNSSPMTERLFVLKDMVFDEDTGNDEIDNALHGIVQSINGQLMSSEKMRPGEVQLWRFGNQSANRPLHLALTGHRLRIIAEDGGVMVKERVVDVIDLPPGSRTDVLVESGEAGHYELVVKGLMTGTGSARVMQRVIATLDVAGGTVAPVAAQANEALPRDLRTARIDGERRVVFSQTTTLKQADQAFFVNGQIFEAKRMDLRVPLGNVEEWTIRNDSDDLHVFHIHQIGFQLVSRNGELIPFAGYLDTVLVPERGEVKLRLPFTDPLILGRFMYHCHVLMHEDKGMMANIEIYDPAPRTLSGRLSQLYLHVLWWWHGVPWSQCGLDDV